MSVSDVSCVMLKVRMVCWVGVDCGLGIWSRCGGRVAVNRAAVCANCVVRT